MREQSIMKVACAAQLKLFADSTNAVVLDTETTGLGSEAEIVEIAVIDTNGKELFKSLVKPTQPIEPEAAAIHGITDAMVANAPTFLDIHEKLFNVLRGKVIGIYNADFDFRLIQQSYVIGINHALISGDISEAEQKKLDNEGACNLRMIAENTICLMILYAGFHGEINRGDPSDVNDYRWQKLTNAATQVGYRHHSQAHRALADCQITLAVAQNAGAFMNLVGSDVITAPPAFYPAVAKLNGDKSSSNKPSKRERVIEDAEITTTKPNHHEPAEYQSKQRKNDTSPMTWFWVFMWLIIAVLAAKPLIN